MPMKTEHRGFAFYSFVPQDRSGRVRWCLEELGLPYERRVLNTETGEDASPRYLALHPLGRVPALLDDNLVIIESGAICLYLAEKHPQSKLVPPPEDPDRGLFLQWLFLCTNHLDPIGVGVSQLDRLPEAERPNRIAELSEDFEPIAKMIETRLQESEFLIGVRFTLADILVGQILYWIEDVLLEGHPNLRIYLDRLKARPAALRAGLFGGS